MREEDNSELFVCAVMATLEDHYINLLIFITAYGLCEPGCSNWNSYCANFTHHQCVNNMCICPPQSSTDNCCKYKLFV